MARTKVSLFTLEADKNWQMVRVRLVELSKEQNKKSISVYTAANGLVDEFDNLKKILATKEKEQADKITPLDVAAKAIARKAEVAVHKLILDKNPSPRQMRELTRCLAHVRALIKISANNEPEKKEILTELEKIVREGKYEKERYSTKYPIKKIAEGLDTGINKANALRTAVFNEEHEHSRISLRNFLSDDLHRFIKLAQTEHAYHAKKKIADPLKTLDLPSQEKTLTRTSHLLVKLPEAFNDQFNKCIKSIPEKKLSNQDELMKQLNELLASLKLFGLTALSIKEANPHLYQIATSAFCANYYDMVFLMKEIEKSETFDHSAAEKMIQKMKYMSAMLEKGREAMENPGDQKLNQQLQVLIKKASSDIGIAKENLSLSAMGIFFTAASTTKAIANAVLTHGMSLITDGLTVMINGIHTPFDVKDTYDAKATLNVKSTHTSMQMQALAKTTSLRSSLDLKNENIVIYLDNLINKKIYAKKQPALQKELMQLSNVLKILDHSIQRNLAEEDVFQSLLHEQADQVFREAKKLAIDILSAEHPSQNRLHALNEGLNAALAVLHKPNDLKNMETLTSAASTRKYDPLTIEKSKIFRGALLSLAGVATLGLAITNTVLTFGIASPSLLSPLYMLGKGLSQVYEGSTKRGATEFGRGLEKMKTLAKSALIEDDKTLVQKSPKKNQ